MEAEQSDNLVLSNLGIAYRLASMIEIRGCDLDDRRQIALIGLIKASREFRPETGNKFSTFGSVYVLNELRAARSLAMAKKRTPCTDGYIPPTSPCPQAIADRREFLDLILSSMTECEREAIHDRFVSGLTFRESGELRGRHMSAIQHREGRGLARARTMIEGWMENDPSLQPHDFVNCN